MTIANRVHKLQANGIRIWLLVGAILLAGQGLALLLLSANTPVSVYASYLAKDSLQSLLTGKLITAPAIHTLWLAHIAAILALMLLVTAVAYAALSVYHKPYERWLNARHQPMRLILGATTATLLLLAVGLIVGMQDFSVLKTIPVFFAIGALVHLAHEDIRQHQKGITSTLLYVAAIIASAMPWLLVLGSMLMTVLFGGNPLPTYTWILYASTLLGFLLIASNEFLAHRKQGLWSNYVFSELVFISLLLVTETAASWQIFAGLLHP